MIWLCIYLWVLVIVVSLIAIDQTRPVHFGDVVRAVFLPVLFPFFFIVHLTRKS